MCLYSGCRLAGGAQKIKYKVLQKIKMVQGSSKVTEFTLWPKSQETLRKSLPTPGNVVGDATPMWGGRSLRQSPYLYLVLFLKRPCPCHWGKKVTDKRKAQSFSTEELMKLWGVGISRKFSCQLLDGTVQPATRQRWSGLVWGNGMYLFVFGLPGPITKGENSGGGNHLDPEKQPDRPSAALDWPQLSRAASRSPSLKSSQV